LWAAPSRPAGDTTGVNLMNVNAQGQLPNQKMTWSAHSASVEEFADWQQRTAGNYASEDTELLVYLSDQLKIEGGALTGMKLNHPVLGLLSYASESNNRLQEFLFAYLAIVVANDTQPAKKLIAGQRLKLKLHPDYVASTHCYG
jgi:hypothetical protein